jgi:quinohemoprotein ethanol dehydrogenase
MPVPAKPPERLADTAKVLPTGKLVYTAYCGVCHGDSAVGSGVVPDLRWSPMLASAELWRSVVLEGSRTQNGMVSFAQVLTPELTEIVRAYVVARANDTYPEVQASLSQPPR